MLFITIYKVVPSGLFKSKNDYFKVNLFPKYKRIFNALHKCWTRRKKVASSAPAIHQSTINVILQQIELSNDILRWIWNIMIFFFEIYFQFYFSQNYIVKNFGRYIQFTIRLYAFNIIKIYHIATSCVMVIKWLSGNYTFIHVYLHLKRSGWVKVRKLG